MLKIQTGLLKNKTNWNEVVKAGKLTKKNKYSGMSFSIC